MIRCILTKEIDIVYIHGIAKLKKWTIIIKTK